MKQQQIRSIYFPTPDLWTETKLAAAKRNISVNSFIMEAIGAYLSKTPTDTMSCTLPGTITIKCHNNILIISRDLTQRPQI